MEGSILIFGGSKEDRKKAIEDILSELDLKTSENNPDLVFVEIQEEKKSIGIDQIRGAINFLQEKPFSHKRKAVIIPNADILTNDAQGALLKTLEELPSYATFILTTATEEKLLPTVVSRCKKIKITKDKSQEIKDKDVTTFAEIIKMNAGKRLYWASEYSKNERGTVIETLEDWTQEAHTGRLNTENAKKIRKLLEIKKDLENTNISLKLALEHLVLSL